MREKEPRFMRREEVVESGPQPAPQGTSARRAEIEVPKLHTTQESPSPAEKNMGASVSFEKLGDFVGQKILFRDPRTQTGKLDDPYYKTATLEQRAGEFVVVVDKAKYFPYYTGDRQHIFSLQSQSDVDFYEVKIEK